jgi:hypothetical protein
VHLDRLLGKALFNQELLDLGPLVSLKLNDLAELFVVDERAVTGEFLLIDMSA